MSVANGSGKSALPLTESPQNGAAPPAYMAVDNASAPPSGPPKQLSQKELDELNAAFSSLNLPTVVTKVDADTCLAHLKLLFAFHSLKEDIGYSDGLFQISDSRAFHSSGAAKDKDFDPIPALAKLREKRWALYVARAVDRYEAWWNSFALDPLVASDLHGSSAKYSGFANGDKAQNWGPEMLPPLGSCPRDRIQLGID